MKNPKNHTSRGFALVVTLSLMILLTVIAVGLLSLSSISLRASGQGEAMATARANARMALMLAIGELQLELGPDRRINCQAGIDAGARPENQNWLAVYDAWNASDVNRPAPSFRRYLVSGDSQFLSQRNAAKSNLPGSSEEMIKDGTLGKNATAGRVKAGLVKLTDFGGNVTGHHAWWIGDQNSKAMINAGQDVPSSVSDILLTQQSAQSAPGTGFSAVESLAGVTGTGRAEWDLGDSLRNKTLSLSSMDLLPGATGGIRKSFHDVTSWSPGLLADVRNGRLKRDLSLYLQPDMSTAFRKRLRQPLYSVPNGGAVVNFDPDSEKVSLQDNLGPTTGITMEELWIYYNLHKDVSYNRPASSDAKVGVIPGGYPTLVSAATRNGILSDPFYPYKREIYSQAKYILSLAAVQNTAGKYDLRLSVDPVVVLWNPYNVALEYQTGGFSTVAFSALPYEIEFDVKSGTGTKKVGPLNFSTFFNDVNGIVAQVGKAHKIILRPGESRVLSPKADATQGGSVTVDLESGWDFTTGAIFDSPSFPKALGGGDSVKVTLRPKITTPSNDYLTYWFGSRNSNPAFQAGTITLQNDMKIGTELPVITTPEAYSVNNIFSEKKTPLMLFSYFMSPERDVVTDTPTKPWLWNNPTIQYRWPANDSLASKLHRQLQMKVLGLDAWENPYVQITPDNQAYWGGGVRADFGVPFFTCRSIPLTPPTSLAALQHSCANGFRRHWKDSPIATSGAFPADAFGLDGHQYLAPMVSKAIGNSFAHPLVNGNKVDGTLVAMLGTSNGGTAASYNIADHSYLANAALWDSWYFSSLSPQLVEPYGSNKRTLQQVFDDFFPQTSQSGKKSVPLPSLRVQSGDESELRTLISSSRPSADAYRKLAAHLMVDGAFNVNSTSVAAWKVILSSLRGHDAARRDRNTSGISLESVAADETPVNGMIVANGPQSEPSNDPQEPAQWTGFRTLTDDEINRLATSLVEQIRLRGPFLSLSDFINRRVGSDAELARQGTLQAAIENAQINDDLEKGSRALGSITDASFPDSGKGSRAAGIPGFITQADLLTPLGPTLQARSDSFTIRAYGQTTDRSGKVIARAWCEATVQRLPEYVDPADKADVQDLNLVSAVNRTFGRRFTIIGFRWLNPQEV
jgi:hypothetical protein